VSDLTITQPAEPPSSACFAADVYDLDLTDGASFRGAVPHEAFDALRAAGGVTWHEERSVPQASGDGDLLTFVESPGFWSVTSHAHVSTVLRDQERFSSQLGGVFLPSLAPESLATFRQMMLNMDPPEHSRLRRILQPIFTPRAIERLRASVDLNAREIAGDLDGLEECDLVTAVSAEHPLRVLADLLGMPREDRHLIFEWSNGLLGLDAGESAVSPEESMSSIAALLTYGQQMADARRAEPQDDIVSRIVHAEVDGERLDDIEFGMFWLLLVVAGNETTRNAISGSVLALQEHDQWGWLGEHPEHLPSAVEELLRYVSPVMHFRRTATRDTVLGDQAIRAGDKVVVWYGAANRDPAVFDDPHGLDLLRSPNPHLAFGDGAHFCLGAHLGRLELMAMLRELTSTRPDLTVESGVERSPSIFINGIGRLPVHVG
jgi:cytochrome P450